MKQEVIDKFNAVTDEAVEDYCKARDGGFCWLWFLERARLKIMESGYLPQQGTALIDARYNNSADAVLDGLLCAARSVESPAIRATKAQPWEGGDLERWKQGLLAFSAMMFDAGCVAAYTRGYEDGFDPVEANASAAIFGDVGFTGLRGKASAFLQEVGGEQSKDLAGEIGDCACSHLYADRHIVECAFKEGAALREAYFRGVCKAAYVVGALFAEFVAAGR